MVLHGRAPFNEPRDAASLPERALHAPLPPDLFRRLDEQDDALFYRQPRKVVHIDADAIAAAGRCIARTFARDGVSLDLMSSWRSHFPADFAKRKLIGLGLNAAEMADNPDLDAAVVHDLNRDPVLPFAEDVFDGVVVTVSIQYLTRPVEVFRDVRRVLKAGCPFLVLFSNRMFPTKAVRVWQTLDAAGRAALIRAYFRNAGGYEDAVFEDCTPVHERVSDAHDSPAPLGSSPSSDPLFAVSARKAAAV